MYSEMRPELPNGLPKWFRNNPKHCESVCFTFPIEFLSKFKCLESTWFADLKLERELELANALASNTVGFSRGNVLGSDHLRKPVEFDDALFEQFARVFQGQLQVSTPEASDQVQHSLGYVKHLHKVGTAYLGWLIQQPAYWDDISLLTESFAAELSEVPIPHSPLVSYAGPVAEEVDSAVTLKIEQATGGENEFFETVQYICSRWRISRFEAIECPILKTPKTSGLFDSIAPDGIHVPQLPDIYPVEGSGEHVDQMNQRRNATLKGHLQGWAEISSRDNKNTQPFESLSRQYQIQHIWRLLKSRYPNCLARKLRSLKPVLAEYFEVGLATIKRDLTALRKSDVGILDLPLETRF